MDDDASITLYRGKANLIDLGSPFHVVIDGKSVGRLLAQESATFDVKPGLHVLSVTYFLLRSSNDLVVRVSPGEVAEFTCRTRWFGSPLISPK